MLVLKLEGIDYIGDLDLDESAVLWY